MKKSTGVIIATLIESATLIINTCITSKISYNEGYKKAQADAQNETSILSQSVNEVDSLLVMLIIVILTLPHLP